MNNFGSEILKYKEDMLKDLAALIAVDSVCSAPLPGKPFGEGSAKAMDLMLAIAQRLGLETHNCGYYAIDARLGKGPRYADVLTHLDVVPAGDGWDSDPFTLTAKDGYLFGRGTADDKGAAIASLYCLKALKDAGIQGNCCLRTIFGGGEEISSNDLDVYYEQNELPEMGFTPDCSYGICNSEKGILRIHFSSKDTPSKLVSFHAGLAVNAVPAKATAILRLDEHSLEKVQKAAISFHQENRPHASLSVESSGDFTTITALGLAAHGAEPELGVNAACVLIQFLTSLFSPEETGALLDFLGQHICPSYHGEAVSIAMEDEPSGILTLNLGIVDVSISQSSAFIDIRYPVTKEHMPVFEALSAAATPFQVVTEIEHHTAPLYVAAQSPLITILKDSYRSVMGEDCDVYSTGGGTYARHTDSRTVAFGPVFKDEPSSNAHNCNEHINLDLFMKHAQICLEAMYQMYLYQ